MPISSAKGCSGGTIDLQCCEAELQLHEIADELVTCHNLLSLDPHLNTFANLNAKSDPQLTMLTQATQHRRILTEKEAAKFQKVGQPYWSCGVGSVEDFRCS